ncbi:uncharacterized protein RB166_014491 [Leptodactylus fuscus]
MMIPEMIMIMAVIFLKYKGNNQEEEDSQSRDVPKNNGKGNCNGKKSTNCEGGGNSDNKPEVVSILVPLFVFLFLLVLLIGIILWRRSYLSQCWRKCGGGNKDVVKMNPGSNVVTIYAKAGHPQGGETPSQLPQSGHIYQEISDVRVGASGPDSSYSTIGLPYQDQKASDQQPSGGQYSLLGLPSQ